MNCYIKITLLLCSVPSDDNRIIGMAWLFTGVMKRNVQAEGFVAICRQLSSWLDGNGEGCGIFGISE